MHAFLFLLMFVLVSVLSLCLLFLLDFSLFFLIVFFLLYPEISHKQGVSQRALARSLQYSSVSKMAAATSYRLLETCQSVKFAMKCQGNNNSTDAVLSLTSVNMFEVPLWRAVLAVKGEKRKFGTRHQSAVESARNLLSKFPDRISAAAKKRVLDKLKLQVDARPRRWLVQPSAVLVGSQPSAELCRRGGGQEKINSRRLFPESSGNKKGCDQSRARWRSQ